MNNERTMGKCDVCANFGYEDEFETVTIIIRKHTACQVGQPFGQSHYQTSPPFQQTITGTMPTDTATNVGQSLNAPYIKSSAPPKPSYLDSELNKMK